MSLDLLYNAGKTDSSDAIFSLVNILKTKPVTGYDNSGSLEGTPSTNIMDIIGFVKNEVPQGEAIINILHQVAPGPALVDVPVNFLKGSPTIAPILAALSPANSEPEMGGDALGAIVTHAKRFPIIGDIVNTAVQQLVVGDGTPEGAGPLKPYTDFLHEISLGGHALAGTIPAGTTLASESQDDRMGPDSLDVVVGFAKGLPVAGDIVASVIPDVFPAALGIEEVSQFTIPLAQMLHDVVPAYEVTNALFGEAGMITAAIPTEDDQGGHLIGLIDILDTSSLLDALLGGSSASASGSASASAGGLLSILDVGNLVENLDLGNLL